MRANTNTRALFLASLGLSAAFLGGCASEKPEPTTAPVVKGGAFTNYAQGVTNLKAGKQDQAIESLRYAIQQNPQLIMPRVVLGKIYKDKGDYASAAEYYEALTHLDPLESDNYYNLGVSYQMLQRLQESARNYQTAIRLNPADFGSTMNLGLVYLALGEVDKAVEFTRKATEMQPASAEAQANYAAALDSKGDYPKAEAAYRKSLDLAPGKSGTLINYANNLLAQGKWQEAVEVLTATLKQEDTPYLHKRLGDALALGTKYDQAIAQYKIALKGNPRYYQALNEMGRVIILQYQAGMELDDKKRDEALGFWRQSVDISPSQPKIKALLDQWEKRMFSK